MAAILGTFKNKALTGQPAMAPAASAAASAPKAPAAGQANATGGTLFGLSTAGYNVGQIGVAAGAAGPAAASTTPAGGGTSGIDGIYDARMASEMQKLQAARDAALQGYNQQETLAKQTGYDNRNAADVVNMQNVRSLKEQMAANGLSSSGDNITASGNLASARLGAINDINRTQGNALQDIAQKRALTISQEAANELALTQQINADRAAAKMDQSRYDDQKALQESQVTGYYQSPEMQQQYGIVNQAKIDYANAKTPQERLAAHKRAQDARDLITQMGGNAGLVGADVTAGQAGANKGQYGIETLAHQQQIWDQNHTDSRDKAADAQWEKSYGLSKAQLTGVMPDGTPTNQAQQQKLEQLWTVADQTGVIPDELAKIYGLPKGTKTMTAIQFERSKFESDRSFKQSQSNSNADNARANGSQSFNQKMDIWKATGKAPAGLSGVKPGTPWGGDSGGGGGGGLSFSQKMDVWKATGVAPEGIPGVQPGTKWGGDSSGSSTKIDAKESTNNYNSIVDDITSSNVDKATARKLLQANADYLSDSDYRALNDWIEKNL